MLVGESPQTRLFGTKSPKDIGCITAAATPVSYLFDGISCHKKDSRPKRLLSLIISNLFDKQNNHLIKSGISSLSGSKFDEHIFLAIHP